MELNYYINYGAALGRKLVVLANALLYLLSLGRYHIQHYYYLTI